MGRGFIQAGAASDLRTVEDKLREAKSVLDFIPESEHQAIIDGTSTYDCTDDLRAAINQVPEGVWLDGVGGTYLITGYMQCTLGESRLRNFNFVFGPNYVDSGSFSFLGKKLFLENIRVDGGRGTYKTGFEPWRYNGVWAGTERIIPNTVNGDRLSFIAFSHGSGAPDAELHLTDCEFRNMHFVWLLYTSGHKGTSFVSDCVFENYSFADINIFHQQTPEKVGQTFFTNIFCKDSGILPDTFLVDDIVTNYSTSPYAVMGAYGLVVAYGDAFYNNITFINYNDTAVTPETCRSVKMNNIKVLADSDRQWSPNPSGAVWLENCQSSQLSNIEIDIRRRNPLDYSGPAGDSNALFLFCDPTTGGTFNATNVDIKLSPTDLYTSKAVRIIARGPRSDFTLSNMTITGRTANAVSAVWANGQTTNGSFTLTNCDASACEGSFLTYGFDNITLDNCLFPRVSVLDYSIFSVSGTPSSFSMRNTRVSGNMEFNQKFGESVLFDGVAFSETSNTTFTSTPFSANLYVKSSRLKNLLFNTSKSVFISDSELQSVTIDGANKLSVVGNKINSGLMIKDVNTFNVSSNDIRISSSTSALSVNPTNVSSVLSGVVNGNNILIKTGTTGAGYTFIKPGVSNVILASNNELTVNYI